MSFCEDRIELFNEAWDQARMMELSITRSKAPDQYTPGEKRLLGRIEATKFGLALVTTELLGEPTNYLPIEPSFDYKFTNTYKHCGTVYRPREGIPMEGIYEYQLTIAEASQGKSSNQIQAELEYMRMLHRLGIRYKDAHKEKSFEGYPTMSGENYNIRIAQEAELIAIDPLRRPTTCDYSDIELRAKRTLYYREEFTPYI